MDDKVPDGVRYRVNAGVYLIQIDIGSIRQLFNSFDPSPFHERDLDDDAEDYIVGCVEEMPSRVPIRLLLHLPVDQVEGDDVIDLEPALHNYFDYRRWAMQRALRTLFAEGRTALAVGVTFLVTCTTLGQLVRVAGEGLWSYPLSEGLLIAGWVAMWRPIEIFLYEWRPIRRRVRIFERLAAMPVDIRPRSPR